MKRLARHALAAVLLLLPPAAAAQDAPQPVPPAVRAAQLRIETLEREIALLRRLHAAQSALLATAAPAAASARRIPRLPPSLCAEPELAAWCAALPLTFERPAR